MVPYIHVFNCYTPGLAYNLSPLKPNGISHSYQLDQSISLSRVVGGIFHFYSNFDSKQWRAELFAIDARLIWLNCQASY